jgi:hypothetical protein
MRYQSIDIEQDDELLNEAVSLKARIIRRVPIFIAVFLFLAVAISGTHTPKFLTSPAVASLSEFESDCLSRDYGPVKEGYDLVSTSAFVFVYASHIAEQIVPSRLSRFHRWLIKQFSLVLVPLASKEPPSLTLCTKVTRYGFSRSPTKKLSMRIRQNICPW